MKILMPGFCRQACASLVSVCLIVATTPLSALPDDRPTSHKSGDLHEPAAIQPLSRQVSRSSLPAATLDLPPGDASAAGVGMGSGSSISAQVAPQLRQVHAEGQPKANKLTKAKFPASQPSRITFIENKGQFDERVKFQVANAGRTLWLTQNGIVFDFLRNKADQPKSSQSEVQSSRVNPAVAGMANNHQIRHPAIPEMERHVVYQNFVGAKKVSTIQTKNVRPGTYNYFLGSDPTKWRTDVRAFGEILYKDVWNGIDVELHGSGPNVEEEFVIQPGADPTKVHVAYRGVAALEVSENGLLLIKTAFGELRESKPLIYQEIAGVRVAVEGRFRLTSDNGYMFDIGKYRTEYPLIIDPTLLYSTFLGGSSTNTIVGMAVDTSGSTYLAGVTASQDFPTTSGTLQSGSNIFVTKLNASGSALVYSSILGRGFPRGFFSSGWGGIALDNQGNAYVTGFGFNVPTTANAYSSCSGFDSFLTVLAPAGNQLVYSTCLNSAAPVGLAVDSGGRAFLAGQTGCGLATTSNAFQPNCPSGNSGFLRVFDKALSGTASLVYSSYLGDPTQSLNTFVGGIALDSFGKAYVTGQVYSSTSNNGQFPTTPGAFRTTLAACTPTPAGANQSYCQWPYVAKFDTTAPGANSLIYSTYIGYAGQTTMTGDGIPITIPINMGIAVDGSGNAYITGGAGSTYPTTPGAYQVTGSGTFVTKLNASGSNLVYSTFLPTNPYPYGGGTPLYTSPFNLFPSTVGFPIAVDAFGQVYISGNTTAANYPVTPGAFQSKLADSSILGGGGDAFLTILNSSGSGLIYSSYVGGGSAEQAIGVAVDQIGDAYVAGQTTSLDFPVTTSAYQPSIKGTSSNLFVSKFPLSTNQALSVSSITPVSGGNAGTVSPQIFGTGFHAGATAQLNCSSAVSGTNLTVGPGGRFLNTTFNLTAVQPSTCDVVVTNPDGTSASLPQAFSVQQGGEPSFQIYLTGVAARQAPPEVALSASKTLFLVTTQNTGDADASGVLITAALSPEFSLAAVQPTGSDSVPNMAAAGVASWLIPNLAPGQSTVLTYLGATAPATAFSPVPIGPVWELPGLLPPLPNPLPPPPTFPLPTGAPYPTVAEVLSCIEEDVQGGENDGGNCMEAAEKCGEAAAACKDSTKSLECASAFAECEVAAAKCALTEKCVPTGKPTGTNNSSGITNNCEEISSAFIGVGGNTCITLVTPADPNNLVGPSGVDVQRWIKGKHRLTYGISFSNEPTATAPAQAVIVTQPLGSNVNLSTVSLPIITVPNGDTDVPVSIPADAFNSAAGVSDFNTNVDLRPNQSLLVNVDANLNPVTQTLTWTFTSIDPTTGQPPLNPLVGFLPPGAGAFLSFSATPKPDLVTGAQIAEQATIVFQGASAMSTQAWTNSIDNTPPASQVTALPASEPASGFTLNWSGTDVGSGVQDFTIFVSDNGAPFTPFQTNTTATSATFTGEVGHTYGFYSVARDLVGNVEANKTAAEATTQVVLATDSIPPTTSALAAPSPNVAGWNNSNVTVTLNSADDLGGTGVKQVSLSATGAQPIASTTVTGAATSFQVANEGITTIAFFGTDNAGNVETSKALTVELDKTPPSIVGSRTPLPNASGWSNTDVTVSFACADSLSGLAPGSPPANTVFSSEGANQNVSGTCQDLAGNSAQATVGGINIDKTAPVISGMPASGCTFNETGKLIQLATVSGADALSGLASLNVSVTSSQTSDDLGEPDIVVIGSGLQPRIVQIRAKIRQGAGSRTYTINSTAIDAAGNPVNANSTCTVTKSH